MGTLPITKNIAAMPVQPHLIDYAATCTRFSWQTVRQELGSLPDGGGLNIAHVAVDRHASGPMRQRVAIRHQ